MWCGGGGCGVVVGRRHSGEGGGGEVGVGGREGMRRDGGEGWR